MEEIPFGEMVRVRKAIRILERKNLKPLSSNLNKILCKPLRRKTTIFPPSPFPDKSGQIHNRSQSNSGYRSNQKALTYVTSQQDLEMPSAGFFNEEFEFNNPLISPGTDKKKNFNEMKSLLSPALRNNLPKLCKPDLAGILNEKKNLEEEFELADQNQSFVSQNFSLKNLLKQTDSTTKAQALKKKGKEKCFFPDESPLTEKTPKKKKSTTKQTTPVLNRKKSLARGRSLDSKYNLKIQMIPKDEKIENQKNKESSGIKATPMVSGNSVKNFQRKKQITEISDQIARNIKKLQSTPIIKRKLPVLINHISEKKSNNVSLSVDFQNSFNKNALKSNNSSTCISDKNNDSNHLRICKKNTFDLGETKVLSSRYDFQDQYLAIGCEDSIIRIFNIKENNKLEYFLKDNNNLGIATTCIRWKPKSFEKILLSTQATGVVDLWDVFENEIIRVHDEDNYVYTCDFNSEGDTYATGGSDTKIRIYDIENKMPISFLMNQEDNPGHSNRVYNLLFHPEEPNILYSGGWDCNIFIWDLRIGESVNFISGPMICGDSMDLRNHELLTGSWRNDKQIEIWDLRNMKLLANVPWVPDNPEEKSFIYSCKFSKATSNYIVAGSTGKCELRLFDKKKNYKNIASDKDFEYGIFSVDFKYSTDEFVCGTGEGKINSYFIK